MRLVCDHLGAGLVDELDKASALFQQDGESVVDLMKSIVVVRLIFMGLNRLKADVIRNYTKIFFIFLQNIVAAKNTINDATSQNI